MQIRETSEIGRLQLTFFAGPFGDSSDGLVDRDLESGLLDGVGKQEACVEKCMKMKRMSMRMRQSVAAIDDDVGRTPKKRGREQDIPLGQG